MSHSQAVVHSDVDALPCKVFVVLPVFNRKETTLECLGQLSAQTRPPDMVVVSDGGSSDGTPAAIRAAYPSVVVLETADDLFWGGSIARAIDHVLSLSPSDDDVIVIMNDDVVMAQDVIDVVAQLCREERAAVGAIVVDRDAHERVLDGGVTLDWEAYRFCNTREWPKNARLRDDVDVLTGRTTAVLVEMVRRAGNVDGRAFPHYLGDYDFAQRIKKAGYRLGITSETWIATSSAPSGLGLGRQASGLVAAGRLAFSRRSRVNVRDHARFAFRHAPNWLVASRIVLSVGVAIVITSIVRPMLSRVRAH